MIRFLPYSFAHVMNPPLISSWYRQREFLPLAFACVINERKGTQLQIEAHLFFVFFLQASDGQCHCTIGYQPSNNGSACVNKLYDVCRDGKARTQYGDCMDGYQWLQHCREQVRPCATTWHTQMPKTKKRKGTWDVFNKSTGNSPWRCVWIMLEDFNVTHRIILLLLITGTNTSIFSGDILQTPRQ